MDPEVQKLVNEFRSACDDLHGALARRGLLPAEQQLGPHALAALIVHLDKLTKEVRGLTTLASHGKSAKEERS